MPYCKPKEKLYRLNDFNGLYLEVKPNGKSSMFALAEYPAIKLAEAREKCEQASCRGSQPGTGSSVR
ncbi:Arm DNA-binding domain-containing protein [Pectobacterium sp. A5351]|uniref:Arm DNA-binding domain-containing protein n=1 Tax=Pectobacterium sp. A5351 TaxID=2914983 RepID=UPI002FEDF853